MFSSIAVWTGQKSSTTAARRTAQLKPSLQTSNHTNGTAQI